MEINILNSTKAITLFHGRLLEWLGPEYFFGLFAVGFALWCIRFLFYQTMAPTGHKRDVRVAAAIHLICGPIVLGFVVIPVDHFAYLNEAHGIIEYEGVTPASAAARAIISGGSDYLTQMILTGVMQGADLPLESSDADNAAAAFFRNRTAWLADLIVWPFATKESIADLNRDAGESEDEPAEGNEGGVINGFGNLINASRAVFSALDRVASLVFVMITNPALMVSFIIGLMVLALVSLWVTLLAYAIPFLYVAIIFVLPVSYCFDGVSRVVPMIKMLVAFALSKPLSVLFIGLAFSVTDSYFLGIYRHDGMEAQTGIGLETIYGSNFFQLVSGSGLELSYATPAVLAVLLAGAVMSILAPVVTFLVLGAEGGTLSGMISGVYMQSMMVMAKIAGKAAGPLSSAAGGAAVGGAGQAQAGGVG